MIMIVISLIQSLSKTKYNFGNDPIICNEDKYLVSPYKLEEANCYEECCLSANRSMHYTIDIIKEYGLIDCFKIEIE